MLVTDPTATPTPAPATISALLRGPIATVRPTATLREAAETLTADDLGLLVVSDAGGMRGVLSERDIVRACAAGAELDLERVRDHASTDVVTVDEEASAVAAGSAMLDADVRHLVVTRGGRPVGVLSVRDVLPVLLARTGS